MPTNTTLRQLHAELAERVADAAQRHNVPGVAIGILLEGAEDYVCHGVTSVGDPLSVDEATFFQIGSTGKTFTATAMMALVERGLVDLATPVRRYLPDFRLQDEAVAASVTVLHLLNHTAGWAGDVILDTGYGDDALAHYVERLAEIPQERPPGTAVAYNNASLSVAGRIIEVVTGQTFETAIQQLVFEPLGLTEHAYFPWEVMPRRFANGHALKDGAPRVTVWHGPRGAHPAGSELAASARDQLRYARFHLGAGDGVLRPETLARMRTATTPAPRWPQDETYGIGWLLRDIAGTQVVAHGGSTVGHQSAFEMVPARGFALIALTNARHGSPLNDELTRWVFEAYLGLAESEPATTPLPAPQPLRLSADELAACVGCYDAYAGTLAVSVAGERLLGQFSVSPALAAALLPPGEEWPADPPFRFELLAGDEFHVTDGPMQGMRGPVLYDADGRLRAIDLGRRMLIRQPA
jgi:CubicO group peptidase (beta-lactamase class C family)